MKIGFIGQGWIGGTYADDFEKRGYDVVRYAIDPPYNKNKEAISTCDIVFIAVPTPSTKDGFDDSIVREVLGLVGKNKIAVIKSTIVPGTTKSIQEENKDVFVMHSPEFLTEATATHDAANPERNLVGIPVDSVQYREKAKDVLNVLPRAKYSKIMDSVEAELVKYGGNVSFYFKVMFMNMLYDISQKYGVDWKNIKEAMSMDSRIGNVHLDPVHKSGRGAGGHCFIKDFAAFRDVYEKEIGSENELEVLKSLEKMNINLLKSTNKDLNLLKGVYGDEII
jgi:UDPglucose 6-dehydrogenase